MQWLDITVLNGICEVIPVMPRTTLSWKNLDDLWQVESGWGVAVTTQASCSGRILRQNTWKQKRTLLHHHNKFEINGVVAGFAHSIELALHHSLSFTHSFMPSTSLTHKCEAQKTRLTPYHRGQLYSNNIWFKFRFFFSLFFCSALPHSRWNSLIFPPICCRRSHTFDICLDRLFCQRFIGMRLNFYSFHTSEFRWSWPWTLILNHFL